MYYEMYVYQSFLQTPLKVTKTSENSSILSSCEIFCGYVVKTSLCISWWNWNGQPWSQRKNVPPKQFKYND